MTLGVQKRVCRPGKTFRDGRGSVGVLLTLLLGLLTVSARAGITFTNLFTFDGTNGGSPCGTLLQARDGYLYGISQHGGPYEVQFGGIGGVFRIGLDGTFTNLAWFDGTNGTGSTQGLVEGPGGNLYGTTLVGGPAGYTSPGTVYRVTPDGVMTSLADFTGTNGAYPRCPLLLAPDGNFYGTTPQGGTHHLFPNETSPTCGTIFRITPDGSLTTLVEMQYTNDLGFSPASGLTLGRDGYLYGTTGCGGAITNIFGWGFGTVFRMTLQGDIDHFASFDVTNANAILWPLIQGPDGNLFGTTMQGGNDATLYQRGWGNVFRASLDGAVTNIYSFDGTNGCYPGGILLAADGNFYGVSSYGGSGWTQATAGGAGNIFKLTPDGRFTVLHSFDGTNGGEPFCGLMQASDGNFYGTTRGVKSYGTIFRLSVPLPAAFKSVVQSNNTVALTWSSVASQNYQVQYRTNSAQVDWINLGGVVTATNGTMTTLDAVGPDTQRFYRVALIP